ncbi:uncharacterized protein FIBRA_01526 [Fibroporia radiculosa]|uniref:RING-type domain-containing protein n=1 Tax=Fibroporia radiculosa TaxID=599839 RepID=J4G114_9APHY|nr:uncharacterized protein FIBRA_01526 [Fibroporia radiculosa]CCL99508.1 predicted protein [Fibroporia radiculosa]
MLFLHPSSTCDVCLDSYSEDKAPYAIPCGHTFCLRCLQLLTRHCCPLCRHPFTPEEVRKLHFAKDSRAATPRPLDTSCPDDASLHAQEFHTRITQITLEGAPREDVCDVLELVHKWLMTQPSAEVVGFHPIYRSTSRLIRLAVQHANLRSAHLLLFKNVEMQSRVADEKQISAGLKHTCQDLTEQLHLAEEKCQELDRLRADELDAAKTMKDTMQDRFDKMEKEWSGKVNIFINLSTLILTYNLTLQYDVCLAECRRLSKEVKELKRAHNPLPQPPRSIEPRYYYVVDKNSSQSEPMVILKDDSTDSLNALKIQVAGKEEMFRLSPVPSTLTIPVFPSATFRASLDDMDDKDSDGHVQKESNNPYLRRSIQPIPIKPSLNRMASNTSLLSRFEEPMSRSVPRGSLDVHMASCSSSPSVLTLQAAARERQNDILSDSLSGMQENVLGLRIPGSRRPSVSSQADPRDPEEQRGRWVAQLREILNDPVPSPSLGKLAEAKESGPSVPAFDSASVCPATPTPVIPPPPPPPSQGTPNSHLMRSNTISRASEAAYAAERARASAVNNTSPTSPAAARDHESMPPPSHGAFYMQERPPHFRTASTESLKSKVSTTTASNLTRSLWAAQRVS